MVQVAAEVTPVPRMTKYTCRDGTVFPIRIRETPHTHRLTMNLHDNLFELVVPKGADWKRVQNQMGFFYDWIEHQKVRLNLEPYVEELPSTIYIPYSQRTFTVRYTDEELPTKVQAMYFDFAFYIENFERKVLCAQNKNTITIYGYPHDQKLMLVTLQCWGRLYADRMLSAIIEAFANDFSISPLRINVKTQKHTWGEGNLLDTGIWNVTLNWRAMLLPKHILIHLCLKLLSKRAKVTAPERLKACLQEYDPHPATRDNELNKHWLKMPWWTLLTVVDKDEAKVRGEKENGFADDEQEF